jgi:hypothetical protein
MEETTVRINEFTVAPHNNPTSGLPYHEWYIEFENEPDDIVTFAEVIDDAMKANIFMMI